MKSFTTEKRGLFITAILLVVVCLAAFFVGRYWWLKNQKIPVKVLILPKFEVGELTGDFPGEAQLFSQTSGLISRTLMLGRSDAAGRLKDMAFLAMCS